MTQNEFIRHLLNCKNKYKEKMDLFLKRWRNFLADHTGQEKHWSEWLKLLLEFREIEAPW
jgi:hypothetical protein